MNSHLKFEYATLLVLSVFLFSLLPYVWWWYPTLFLVPDVGIIGYALNPRAGAWTYNLFHSLATGILLYLLGLYTYTSFLALAGVIIIGHAGFDRLLGYGLKFQDSFKHTHLGNL